MVGAGKRHICQADAQLETLRPSDNPALADPDAAIRAALANPWGAAPLSQTPARSAAIAINDNTRPTPHDVLLPPLLGALEAAGLAPPDIRLYLAGGTHQPMSPAEIDAMLPPEIVARYPIHTHDSDDASQLCDLGVTRRGTPIHCNAGYLAADLRLVVGILAPHQFMGFRRRRQRGGHRPGRQGHHPPQPRDDARRRRGDGPFRRQSSARGR